VEHFLLDSANDPFGGTCMDTVSDSSGFRLNEGVDWSAGLMGFYQ